MERRRFLQMMTAAAVGGAVGHGAGVGGRGRRTDRGRRQRVSRRPRSGDLPGIVLVQNPWTASALNAEVAKILIEENLGNSVEITAIDENTMFAGLAAGDLDACLEVWPSGVTAEEQAYLDEGSVVQLGPLGAVGQIGWYVPRYVQEQFPETATWEGFLDPEVASQFASAETGDLGRFLGTDPSLLAVRRGDHREPRAAAPGRLLRLGSGHRGGPRLGGRRRGADPDVLVGARPPQPRSTTSSPSSCPSTPTSATPTRPRSPAPTRRTCSSRSPAPTSPTRTRR